MSGWSKPSRRFASFLPFLPAALNKRKKPEKWLGKSFVG
jgi:hypothetical protein